MLGVPRTLRAWNPWVHGRPGTSPDVKAATQAQHTAGAQSMWGQSASEPWPLLRLLVPHRELARPCPERSAVLARASHRPPAAKRPCGQAERSSPPPGPSALGSKSAEAASRGPLGPPPPGAATGHPAQSGLCDPRDVAETKVCTCQLGRGEGCSSSWAVHTHMRTHSLSPPCPGSLVPREVSHRATMGDTRAVLEATMARTGVPSPQPARSPACLQPRADAASSLSRAFRPGGRPRQPDRELLAALHWAVPSWPLPGADSWKPSAQRCRLLWAAVIGVTCYTATAH